MAYMRNRPESCRECELLSVADAALVFSLGQTAIRKLAKETGAEVRIGRTVRIDRQKMLEGIRNLYTA